MTQKNGAGKRKNMKESNKKGPPMTLSSSEEEWQMAEAPRSWSSC